LYFNDSFIVKLAVGLTGFGLIDWLWLVDWLMVL